MIGAIAQINKAWFAVGLAAVLAVSTFFWLSQSSVFAIEEIRIEGNRAISEDEVMSRAAPLLNGESMMQLSFDDVERSLYSLPFAQSIEVERDFPHTVRIVLREYRPFVNLRAADSKTFILASEGRTLMEVPHVVAEFPLVSTKEPCETQVGDDVECADGRTAVWFLANIPMSFDQEFAEVAVADTDINLTMRSGVKVHFGDLDDYDLKLEVLRRLLARSGASGATIWLDVSVPERPVTKDNTPPASTTETTSEQAEVEGTEDGEPESQEPMGEGEVDSAQADATGDLALDADPAAAAAVEPAASVDDGADLSEDPQTDVLDPAT